MSSPSRIALVTGAGSGIGREVALTLMREEWSVVLAGRTENRLHETASLAPPGASHLLVPTDVTQADRVADLFQRIRDHFGRLDLLFNNAGTSTPPVPLEDLELSDWQSVVDVNLTGPFLCTREAFRLMKSQDPMGGRIINNGSISATSPRPHSVAYTATKHAITGLTKSTALDGRLYNIACGQIDIGNAATTMTEKMKEGVPQADGRMAEEPRMPVSDVGQAVAYMANLPLESNVLFMTVMATQMPFVGRG